MAALWGNIKLGSFIWKTVVHYEQLWRSIELQGNEQQRPALIYSVMFFWLLWLISLCCAGEAALSQRKLISQPRLEGKKEMGAQWYKSHNNIMNLFIKSGQYLFMVYAIRNLIYPVRYWELIILLQCNILSWKCYLTHEMQPKIILDKPILGTPPADGSDPTARKVFLAAPQKLLKHSVAWAQHKEFWVHSVETPSCNPENSKDPTLWCYTL